MTTNGVSTVYRGEESYVLYVPHADMFLMPEVDVPESNVHYVLLRPGVNGGATFLFHGSWTQPGLFRMLHAPSGLYVTGELRHNGLLWLTKSRGKALLLRVDEVMAPLVEVPTSAPSVAKQRKRLRREVGKGRKVQGPASCTTPGASQMSGHLVRSSEAALLRGSWADGAREASSAVAVVDGEKQASSETKAVEGIGATRSDFIVASQQPTEDGTDATTYVTIAAVDHGYRRGRDHRAYMAGDASKVFYFSLYNPRKLAKNDLGRSSTTEKSLVLVEDAGHATTFEFLAWAPSLLDALQFENQCDRRPAHVPTPTETGSDSDSGSDSDGSDTSSGTASAASLHRASCAERRVDTGESAGEQREWPRRAARKNADDPGKLVGATRELWESSSGRQADRDFHTRLSDALVEDPQFVAESEARGDRMALFFRRRWRHNVWQHRCIARRPLRQKVRAGRGSSYSYFCCMPGADEAHVVLGFGDDSALRGICQGQVSAEGQPGSCYLTAIRVGIPFSVSDYCIRVLLSSRRVEVNETFSVSEASIRRVEMPEEVWYTTTFDATVPMQAPLPSHWPPGDLYYYGYHHSLALPSDEATLVFPYTLLSVQPCTELPGQLEVIAAHYIPQGTSFLYCGPTIRKGTDDEERYCATAMSAGDGRSIRGGNIMRYVNHHFGFAPRGNVAIRRGSVLLLPLACTSSGPLPPPSGSERGAKNPFHSRVVRSKATSMEVVFFVATEGIPAGTRVLVESYGPEYDSYIERLALCRGLYVTYSEAKRLKLPCEGRFLKDMKVGSVVGLRQPDIGTLNFAQVSAIEDGFILRCAPIVGVFPTYVLPSIGVAMSSSITVCNTDAVYFVPGWDYHADGPNNIRFVFPPEKMLLPP